MNLLIVVIEKPERIEDFLSALVELDVVGLQVLDTSSVVEVLAGEAPIFAGLRQLVTRPKAEGKSIFGLTKYEDTLKKLGPLLAKVGLDLNKPDVGYAVLLPVTDYIGQLDLEAD